MNKTFLGRQKLMWRIFDYHYFGVMISSFSNKPSSKRWLKCKLPFLILETVSGVVPEIWKCLYFKGCGQKSLLSQSQDIVCYTGMLSKLVGSKGLAPQGSCKNQVYWDAFFSTRSLYSLHGHHLYCLSLTNVFGRQELQRVLPGVIAYSLILPQSR